MPESDRLEQRLTALEQRPPPKHGEHGRHGRDGKAGRDGRQGPEGPRGSEGAPGPTGKDGSSVIFADVAPALLEEAKALVDAIPRPVDGKVGQRGIPGIPGTHGKQGETGPRGPPGERGKTGETGPMPQHRWDGTVLQFERADGKWGERVDLEGPRGPRGPVGGGGGGGGTTTTLNSWFPGGW